MSDTRLVVGATGLLGGEICRMLAERGDKVRALVRPTANPERLVVKIFENESGRKFEVEHVHEEALRVQVVSATDAMSQTFAGLMLQYAAGDAIEMQRTLQLSPVQLTSVRDYAKRVMS